MTTPLPLEPIETASRDELTALQLERLKWSLRHAYDNSPVYRRKFDEAGVHPDDLQTLADLSRFPFTTKSDLRDSYPFGMFAVPQERVSRIHASSGTTGKMLSIADEFERQGVDPAQSSLRIGIFGAEPWTNDMRVAIEQRMKIDAVDIYGLSEVMGPGVASECVETKDGPTIWEDHFYPEIIDPDTGEVLPDGELGELVFTSLTKEALPIIRYRTRDLTRLLPGTARTMRRMEKITGRSDDMMIVRGVNVFPTQIEEQLLKQLDVLTLNVEPCPETAPDTAAIQAAKQALAYDIKSLIGVTAVVNVLPVNGIERSVGKARRVIDKRKG